MTEEKKEKLSGGTVITLIVGVAVFMALSFHLWVRFGRIEPQIDLEPKYSLPEFSLISQDGKAFGTKDLEGKVWAASFIFTTCKDICPMLTATMHRLQKAMPDSPDFHMVSISVDPEKDTPEELSKYAVRAGADTSRWTFLTGKKPAIKNIIVDGFKLGARPGERIGTKDDYDIVHSNRIALVDRQGRVRAYFDGTLSAQYPRLKLAAKKLLEEKP